MVIPRSIDWYEVARLIEPCDHHKDEVRQLWITILNESTNMGIHVEDRIHSIINTWKETSPEPLFTFPLYKALKYPQYVPYCDGWTVNEIVRFTIVGCIIDNLEPFVRAMTEWLNISPNDWPSQKFYRNT